MSKVVVGAVRAESSHYPEAAPFHPSEKYPEYPFPGQVSLPPNHVYAGVRELFRFLGLDVDNYGTPHWNPLGYLVKPGMTVVLKPNFVLSRHKEKKDLFAIITHPSVLRAVADYCWIALRGSGRIIIADAPQYDCNWTQLMEATKLVTVADFYAAHQGPEFELRDLRNYWSPGKHFDSLKTELPGDPQGSMVVNLGKASQLYPRNNPDKYYGAVYHRSEVISHHTGERQEYEVSRTIMDADVVISIPKLKVHKKVGVTLNAKGLVGINTNKNYLVHYTLGSPSEGGDQYPDNLFTPVESFLIKTERWMYDHLLASRVRFLEYLHRSTYWLHNHTTKLLDIKIQEHKRLYDAGNWYGNDSAWRMTVDLFRVFCFMDRQGRLHDTPQRKMFTIIDGIVGGDGKGPLEPDPVPSGVLIGSGNLLAADIVATRLMGFDPMKVKTYSVLLTDASYNLGMRTFQDIAVTGNVPEWANCLTDPTCSFLGFKPYPSWVNHIEITSTGEHL
jgi:uncharacterized protein (DUF362 family)